MTRRSIFAVALTLFCTHTTFAADSLLQSTDKIYTNSIGMKLVRIEPGTFTMGKQPGPLCEELIDPLSYPTRSSLHKMYPHGDPSKFQVVNGHVRNGDFDEHPAHTVRITKPYYMGAFEVTNKQYELFDPSHKKLRGKNGFSTEDDEAVVYVNFYEAQAFCKWLCDKEGLHYRLPTEAEWEYACRAGTTTNYSTGDTLPKTFHKNQRRTSFNLPGDNVKLTVGQTPPNPWGLYDMHGNVEQWCSDWYGPYISAYQVDPIGRVEGDFKVTRGGSHGTNLYYLRSANRMGTLPTNKHWLIGCA
jgi:formylglycine-generating enzyme required for sulfatase activity